MTSELNWQAVRATPGGGWHGVDDVIMLARRERASWLRNMIRGLWTGTGRSRLGAVLRGWRGARAGRAEVGELLRLDDRTLADIGLRREDLWAVRYGRTTLTQLLGRRDERKAELLTFRLPEAAAGERPVHLDRAA